MPRRIYAKGPSGHVRSHYIFSDDVEQTVHVPDLTVFEAEPEWVDTGLLDQDGEKIQFRVLPEPIGFFTFDEDGRPIL